MDGKTSLFSPIRLASLKEGVSLVEISDFILEMFDADPDSKTTLADSLRRSEKWISHPASQMNGPPGPSLIITLVVAP